MLRRCWNRLPNRRVGPTEPLLIKKPGAAPRWISQKAAPQESSKPYYVTTPIYYVNAAPHIGHLYSSLLADVTARYARLRDPTRKTEFCTGTDEHGMKIQKAAEDNHTAPQAFCDTISERFRNLASEADISYTRFIRTTEDVHYKAVQHLWTELERRGYIYKGSHSGWYSVSDETFYSESQVVEFSDPKTGEMYKVAKESGSKVEWTSEDNYMFRLSAFRPKLIEWLRSDPTAIVPASRHAELLSSLLPADSLQDLSISRPSSRLSWGIPVPNDPDHTIYVWVDALTNYITARGYPWADPKAAGGWPADVQVIGKDIVRFHAIYWPALLFALNLPPPKTLLVHAHWTVERSKMSKSKGNVVNPSEVMKTYGVDAIRYYLARIGDLADDSDWSAEQLNKHYSRDLAGVLGNFASRLRSEKLVAKLPDAYRAPVLSNGVYIPADENQEDLSVHSMIYGGSSEGDTHPIHGILRVYEDMMDKFAYNRALASVMDLVTEANRHFHQMAIWSPETSIERLTRTHFYSCKSLQVAGILLQPFMPTKSMELLDLLGIPDDQRSWSCLEKELRPKHAHNAKDRGLETPSGQMMIRPHAWTPSPVLFPRLK